MYLVVKDKDGDITLISEDYKQYEPYCRYQTVKKIPVKTLLAARLIYDLETEAIYTPQEVIKDLRDYYGSKISLNELY